MSGWLLTLAVALVATGLIGRSWPRCGPASSLRRGLWLLAPAVTVRAASLVVADLPALVVVLELVALGLVAAAVLRATPARGVRSTREHISEAVIAGLLVAVLAGTLLPAEASAVGVGLVVLAAEAAILWLVVLGRRDIRLQGRALRWLVGGGAGLSILIRFGAEPAGLAGAWDGWGVLGLLPVVVWTLALAHPQVRTPLSHVVRSAPGLAPRQVLLVVAAALVGPATAVVLPLLGRPVDGPVLAVVSGLLTLLVVLHLVQLVEQRGQHVWEAQHDALTGLPAEPLYEDRLRQAIASARRSGSGLVVAFVDLDGFKDVNDTCGHEAGDEVLRRVATRLTEGLRDHDTVARRSGDEFLLLLADTDDPAVAEAVLERLMSELAEPIEVDGESHVVGASIGLAAWPRDGLDADELVQHADEAMYEAKEAGRGQLCWYRTMSATRTQLRLTLAHHLQTALQEGGQLELDHEPVVDLRDGRVVSLACRARWRHPSLGRLTPSAFVPVATRSGLWRALDLEVLRLACLQISRWRAAGVEAPPLSVRLCDDHAGSEELATDVLAVLARYGVAHDRLTLTVSEGALARGGDVFARSVDTLADHGVAVTVAGFGAGDVGVFRLSHVRIAAIELAARIVQRASGVEGPVVDTVIRLADGLGLAVQGAGVSSGGQAEVLRSRGCLVARGPALAPPLAGRVLDARLAAHGTSALAVDDLLADADVDADVPPTDGVLTATLAGDEVLESELTALLRQVGALRTVPVPGSH